MKKIQVKYYSYIRVSTLTQADNFSLDAQREKLHRYRREFCEYFDIPYRTVTEWERDNRHAPAYVLRLLKYYIRME